MALGARQVAPPAEKGAGACKHRPPEPSGFREQERKPTWDLTFGALFSRQPVGQTRQGGQTPAHLPSGGQISMIQANGYPTVSRARENPFLVNKGALGHAAESEIWVLAGTRDPARVDRRVARVQRVRGEASRHRVEMRSAVSARYVRRGYSTCSAVRTVGGLNCGRGCLVPHERTSVALPQHAKQEQRRCLNRNGWNRHGSSRDGESEGGRTSVQKVGDDQHKVVIPLYVI